MAKGVLEKYYTIIPYGNYNSQDIKALIDIVKALGFIPYRVTKTQSIGSVFIMEKDSYLIFNKYVNVPNEINKGDLKKYGLSMKYLEEI